MIDEADISPATALLLNAGQLAFATTDVRAVALALACLTETQDHRGAKGTGFLPDRETLIDCATEHVTAKLDGPVIMFALDVLSHGGYLVADQLVPGMPYVIDTTTLPCRFCCADDCPAPVEHDALGHGDS
jgi:hypothetical protein